MVENAAPSDELIELRKLRQDLIEGMMWIRSQLEAKPTGSRIAYSIREFAAALGHTNVACVYEAVQRGEIPCFIPPGYRGKHIPASWVEAKIAEAIREAKS